MKKLKKLIKQPGLFFRDYLIKRYPVIHNEINCKLEDEAVLLHYDLALEKQLPVNFPIDIVFTWVNDKDPMWQARYNEAQRNIDPNYLGRYAMDSARFANHDELRYSLHSALINLPWIRRVYIVTDRQCPSWLTPDDRVRIVDHSELIDVRYLPTFNSHVIEAHLHRIEGLSEHFIYFNDDVFVARSLPPGHFFRGNGLASLFLSNKSLLAMQARGADTPTLSASLNVSALFEACFESRIDTPLVHTYVPLHKSTFESAWHRWSNEIERFLPNRFRGQEDLNLATCLVPWLMYQNGDATPSRDICHYFNIRSAAADQYWTHLTQCESHSLPHSFCANDFSSAEKNRYSIEGLEEHLASYFDLKG